MNRADVLARLESGETWDVIVIGGGATGLGVAVDAAARGYRTALLERDDFAQATSSRSTKIVHGGVRYLRNGEVGLVRSALHERGLLEKNASHVVRRQPFVIPVYRGLDIPFYGLGLKFYEALSGRLSFGPTRMISREETQALLPTVRTQGLRGGVVYYDGQFDDARLAIVLAKTANRLGAAVANHCAVRRLVRQGGQIAGVEAEDTVSGRSLTLKAHVVVNATGVFTDAIRALDDPAAAPLLTISSGVHLVFPAEVLPTRHAMMVPKTADGRVLFAVPWLGRVIVGTTDEPFGEPVAEPRARESEIAFLEEHAARYFSVPVARTGASSVFSGLRPLVKTGSGAASRSLSRDHFVLVSPAGLVTVTGGKWTSYRKMAEDAVSAAAENGGLPPRPPATATLRLHGANGGAPDGAEGRFARYGTDARLLEDLVRSDYRLGRRLHPRLPYFVADVVWAARHEMALTLDDVLMRRLRALALDARAAIEIAPTVAGFLATELGRPSGWAEGETARFLRLASAYVPA